VQLFSPDREIHESSEGEEDTDKAAVLEETPSTVTKMDVDDENPF
jgi:hypothetical protein